MADLLDISGFGGVVNLVASNTFPAGITITQFSNDADPFDTPSVKTADTAMGVNGDFMKWNKAVGLPMTLNVIPGSDDDQNLQILAEANRVAQGKLSASDVITATIVYPDNSMRILIEGCITDASFGKSISGEGRIKTKEYKFMFADTVSA